MERNILLIALAASSDFCLLYTSYLWKELNDLVNWKRGCCEREGKMMCVVTEKRRLEREKYKRAKTAEG